MSTYANFGNLLKSNRERRGLEQLELARMVGVTQQTVSRWEKGASRPDQGIVHQLAQIFEVDIDEWLIAAGYSVDKPVRPLLATLPFNALSEDDFERFCRDLVQRMYPKSETHRYGYQGHTQHGIDIFSKDKDVIRAFQCKKRKKFGPADVAQTIAETSFTANHYYILLSRIAGSDARDEVEKHPNWSLWDAEDLSAKIRTLPLDDQVSLIDTYFGSYREAFLGIDQPKPWRSAEEYIQLHASKEAIFSHGWSLAGRREQLEALKTFALSEKPQGMLLIGRGGIGKSRILRELACVLPKDYKMVFLERGTNPTPKDIEQLPKRGLFVIDDAHEFGDLSFLFGAVARRPYLRLLISTRPYGKTRLKDELYKAGVSVGDDLELTDLKAEDTQALSEEIIKELGGDIKYAERIAEVTKDCPLATVIGSYLVARNNISPEILNNSNDFREYVLGRFRDIVAGDIGGTSGSRDVRELLNLVSLIQPVSLADPNFEQVATKMLNRRGDQIARDMSALEDAGVLVRHNNQLRIAPDLLADFIRAEASYLPKDRHPTKFADEVFKNVKGDLAINLLINLSQLDWRMMADGIQSAILDDIWKEIEQQFRDGGILERESILNTLEKIAYYQPERMINLARFAISNPTSTVSTGHDEYAKSLWWQPSYTDVLEKLPPILKYAAYTLEHMSAAMDILRELAKMDERPADRYADHPVRVMSSLASIEPNKPPKYIDAVVNHVISWLPSEDNRQFSPFDVLDAALATEGQTSSLSGITLTIQSFLVDPQAMA
ncbi:helix-turn-helix domain-containing protein, partial [Candidatus Saccharibacteria bacterium]|nr:helix-turn-helix domain-containing protein [Candidatus Saccharibacteria bacterium]